MEEVLQNPSFTQIAESTEITADIISNKDLIVSGKIRGKAETTSSITLLKTGVVSGHLTAASMDIAGNVKGEIRVFKKLFIRSSAHIDGDIIAAKIIVEEGATIQGNIRSGDTIDVENIRIGKSVNEKREKNTESQPKVDKKPEEKAEVKSEPKPEPIPAPSRFVANVLIALQDNEPDKNIISKLTDSCRAFMEALKYNLDTFDDPVLKPFFQKLIYVRKTHETEAKIEADFTRAKEIIEKAFMRKNGDQNGDSLSQSATNIVAALNDLNAYIILLGRIMIVQYSDNSVQSLAIELVNDEIITELKRNDRLTRQPKELYEQLTK